MASDPRMMAMTIQVSQPIGLFMIFCNCGIP